MMSSVEPVEPAERSKKYLHWKESQMELLTKYLQTHVDYATSPCLESCYYIKRDVFPDDDEVTPKRLFGKICNMRAAFRRSGMAAMEGKKKRRRRHSHMDSIYNEYEPQNPKYSSPQQQQQSQQQLVNNAQVAIGLGSTISPGSMLRGGRQIPGQQQQQLPSLWSNRPPGTSSATAAAVASATTQEGMITLMRNSIVDQLHHWDEMTNRMFREKSPQDLLIEYLQKKMEQDAELNRILIASTERMAKFQADAQIQSASLLKKCANTLRNFANGQKDDDEEEEEDEEDDEEEEDEDDVLGVN